MMGIDERELQRSSGEVDLLTGFSPENNKGHRFLWQDLQFKRMYHSIIIPEVD